MTQKEIIADHERRIIALEELVKALTLRSIEVKPSNIISHLPRPNNTPKIINFETEPYLGSGRLYTTQEVKKLLNQQTELTRNETLEECAGIIEKEITELEMQIFGKDLRLENPEYKANYAGRIRALKILKMELLNKKPSNDQQ